MSYTISPYISSPVNAVAANVNLLVYTLVDSQIVQLFGVIDAIPEETHAVMVGKSDYAIETGATLTDHAFIKPTELTITGYVSDLLIQNFSSLASGLRDKEAWQRIIYQIQQREPVTAVTTLATYENMLITDVTTDRNAQFAVGSLVFRMRLSEVLFAQTQTVALPADQLSGAATNRSSLVDNGEKQSETATSGKTESILSRLVSDISSLSGG